MCTAAGFFLTKIGEFRVQERFGGYAVNAADAATPELIAFAEQTLQATPEPVLYARVDVVVTKSGPKLMELEIFEPEFKGVVQSVCPRICGGLG